MRNKFMMLLKWATALLVLYLLSLMVLYNFQENFIFLATQFDDATVIDSEFNFSERNIHTEDGGVIHILHLKPEHSKGKILYFHGNAGDVRKWAVEVEDLINRGWEVFLPDYRGYGKSKGKRSSELLYADALAIYEVISEEYNGQDILVYGRSLGATFATAVAATFPVKQLFLETPFYSLDSLMSIRYPIVPSRKILKFQFPTFEYLKKVKSPICIVHGTSDRVVPYEQGLALSALNDRVQFKSILGGGHNNLKHYKGFQALLDSYFGPRPSLDKQDDQID